MTARFVAVREVPRKPYALEMQVLDSLRDRQMLVSQCETDELSPAWGGLLTTAALSRKARGVVTDGGARDYEEIVELEFPTFCRGLTPYDSLGRMDVVEIQSTERHGDVAKARNTLTSSARAQVQTRASTERRRGRYINSNAPSRLDLAPHSAITRGSAKSNAFGLESQGDERDDPRRQPELP